jgi:hypothetical protein
MDRAAIRYGTRRKIEALGIAVLVALVGVFLATSWRKWPDSLIDFGRELYLPWQLSQGAVLFRDAEDFYGPFSQYFNAGLFKVFGTSMMVLVTANIAVFSIILAAIYLLFRRAWGPFPAWVASALFVCLFAFADSTGLGNYNYATPYSHEATHGVLACLLLVFSLARWLERPAPWQSFVCGVLMGVASVLKPEILLAAIAVTAAAASMGWRQIQRIDAAAWFAGAAIPMTAFIFFFAKHVPLQTAAEYAGRAWLSVVSTTRFTGDPSQLSFLGFDQPLTRLIQHLGATATAIAAIGLVASGALLGDKFPKRRGIVLIVTILAAATVSASLIAWELAGRCLMGLSLLYILLFRPTGLRLMLGVLGLTLLARMALNGRLHQFGFYQAAIATLVISAVVIAELPERMKLSAPGRRSLIVGFLCLLIPGVSTLVSRSQDLLAVKTFPVGTGGDLFYAVDPSIDNTGNLISAATSELRRIGSGKTLLVLPDGEMVNYLARMRSPVAPAFFFSSATVGGREADIVVDLSNHPPDWIAIVSRDLSEFGIAKYGESEGQGKLILAWISREYELAGTMGGDPLDPTEQGIQLLKKRTSNSDR